MSQLQGFVKVQDDLYARLSKTKSNFKKSPKDRITKQYVEARLENVEELWTQFSLTHTQMVKDCESIELTKSPYTTNEVYFNTEELYLDFKCELKTVLNRFKSSSDVSQIAQSSSNSESRNMPIKLPKISIPTFSGKYTEWITFRDLFISLIHKNDKIDKVQKLHYLKGYLTGEAEQLLRHIPISDLNYDKCWAQLESRYNNKKYLSHWILKRLFSQKNITNESASGLKDLMDTTSDCLNALINLELNDTAIRDILIIHILTLKLDSDSRKEWELRVATNIDSDKLPTFEHFKEFLTSRYRAFEFLEPKSTKNQNVNTTKAKVFHTVSSSCPVCNEDHKIGTCKQFMGKDVDARRKFVEENHLCFNCLGGNHSARYCKCTVTCRICQRKHHTLLHSKNEQESLGEKSTHTVGAENQEIVACFSKGTANNQVLLATALVKAVSKNGSMFTVRALLDQGSQASFVTEHIVQTLGLKKTSAKGSIVGIDVNHKLELNSVVKVKIQSRIDPSVELVVTAYVLKSLTSLLPSRETAHLDWVQFQDIPLADPKYHKPDKVDLLLGAEIYGKVLQNGFKKASGCNAVAQCTSLGWILSGTIASADHKSSDFTVMHALVGDDELLKRFWELEKEPEENKKHILTEAETKCEEIFTATTTRDDSGRYVVNLPFRTENPGCKYGQTRDVAMRRFHALESKLRRNEELGVKYSEVINEYLELGHMKPVSKPDDHANEAVYLPHHAVIRNDKDTTKVRVVFDASCKGKTGISLNDDLLVGPSLQPDLRHLLMRWRRYPICMVSDIVKMYRQVRVVDKHQDFQRILWRDNRDSELKDYQLQTVTFGTAAAPFLAVRAMQQVAYDEGKDYPLAAEKTLKDFYVDDLMTGCETVEEGIEICTQMEEMLAKAGFELQKWSSNSNKLLAKIVDGKNKEMDRAEQGIWIKQDEILKTLGLTWNRSSDTFQYSVQLHPVEEPVTKRKMLSDIARLFDPLGWVAPVIVKAKMQIQALWISGIGWDDEIPIDIKDEWFTYRHQLQDLAEFSVPRWLKMKHGDKHIDLHGFCDASKSAYAAVVYARVVDANGGVSVTLVTAKTNVAPIKTVSIPRLELCGAVLLAKLVSEISLVMGINKSDLHFWTDSEIVLAWLNSHPNKWKTFVANRVSEILCKSEPHQWNHVTSKNNPADCASRGMYASEFIHFKMWLEGPEFLKATVVATGKRKSISTELEEKRVHVSVNTEHFFWDKYSSLDKLLRIVAYVRRFLELRKPKTTRKTFSYITAEELELALETCIRVSQGKRFEAVITNLGKGENCKEKVLKSLNPYLDSKQILRVGGRLERSDLDHNRKHPILIPGNDHLTNLLISDAHNRSLHGGPQLMLNCLSTKYYILGAKRLITAYVRKCVTCIRYAATTKPQLMGQLPPARVTPSRPFKNSGVDYAGPINLRTSKGRGHHAYKGYICLFVCMATKAVHIEVVSDLTTKGFIAAFKRFVARRGHCKHVWSDNGTNFQGASKELDAMFRSENSIMKKEIASALAAEGTTWHYIPPHSPNFGGLWEAGIKSCKRHLRRVIGNSTLTYEEMSTLLSQVEACLNSRPFCRITDSNSCDALTPGHFLIGEPVINAPDRNYEDTNISSLKRWQLVQQMLQQFWRRWSSEYLTTLLHRYKWSTQTPEPNLGDIVLIKEDNMPPCRWLLGRVVEKHPGLDNLTRVVTLSSNGSKFKRPTSKLCVLPIT